MVVKDLQTFWTMVRSYRKGNENAITTLRLIARGGGRGALEAQKFLQLHDLKKIGNRT